MRICTACHERLAQDGSDTCLDCGLKSHVRYCLNCGQDFADDPDPDQSAQIGLCYHCRRDFRVNNVSPAALNKLISRLRRDP